MNNYDIGEYKSFEQLDAELEQDLLVERRKLKKRIIICIIILIFVFKGAIFNWLRFSIAIPSSYVSTPINVIDDPVQIDYTDEEKIGKTFIYNSLINKNSMKLIPQAHYVLSGLAIAQNHSFVLISDFFDSAALYDLGVAWGELSAPKVFKKCVTAYNYKVEFRGSRILTWSYKPGAPLDKDYIDSHISHTHIIPANRNIMAAMLKIRNYKKVVVEGELVDMDSLDGRQHYHTSLSRTDTGDGDRGNGACETLYVTQVRIGNKVYK